MLNNIPIKPGANNSGYRGREMDQKARKEREDKQRQLTLQKRQLELKEMDLKTQEDKHLALRREITRLESQSQSSASMNSGLIAEAKNLERQSAVKIADNEKKIKALEQEVTGIDRSTESKRMALIAQKEREEEQDSKHIAEIKEDIRRKTLELKTAEDEDKKLQQEILQLKNHSKNPDNKTISGHPELKASEQQSTQKTADRKVKMEKLKNEISVLNKNLETKKQQVEVAKKAAIDKQKQLLQEKTQEAVLTVNRIDGIKQEIKMIQDRIQALER